MQVTPLEVGGGGEEGEYSGNNNGLTIYYFGLSKHSCY